MANSTKNTQKQIPPKPQWTEPEKWAWRLIRKGEIADFNFKHKKDLDPRKEEGWKKERLISKKFLEAILFEDKYSNILQRKGIFISGAWIKEKLDFRNARINLEIQLTKCRFESYVDLSLIKCNTIMSLSGSTFCNSLILSYAKFESYLNLIGVKVEEELDMNISEINGPLFMRDGAEFKDIVLGSAKVAGQLDMTRSKVTGTLNMDSLSVGASLFMRDGAEFKDIVLGSAKVNEQLDMTRSKVTGTLDMDSLSVGASLFMRYGAEFKDIVLRSAKVDGQLSFTNAKVRGTLDMDSLSVASSLFMSDGAEFNEVVLRGAKVTGQLDMTRSKVTGTLDMDSLSVGASLFMRYGAEFNDIVLRSAEVTGQLSLTGAKVRGTLDMDSLSVASSLFMSDGAEFNEVVLRGAKITRQLSLTKAKVRGTLDMDSLSIASSLFMSDGAEFNNVSMLGAKIGDQLDLTDAIFSGDISIESCTIEKEVFLRAKKNSNSFSFILSKINGNVYISGPEIYHLDLGGTKIAGELNVGYAGQKIKWEKNSFMNLRNTEVGALQDAGRDCWPDELNLDGLTYSRLGGLFGQDKPGTKQINERDSKWFIKWMAKDKSYSPQPYQHLASTLVKMGYPTKANTVLYAAKNRERDEVRKSKLWKRWLGLSLLKWTIGYGFGGKYFRSLIWVAGLIVLGVIVLNTMDKTSILEFWDKIGFSTDMLLPIIDLNKKYQLDFTGWQLYYFYFHKLMGFLLGSFVVAGLSGITKK